jgi:hypothetical protein
MMSLDQNGGMRQGHYVRNSLCMHISLYHCHRLDADALNDTNIKTMDKSKDKIVPVLN